MRTTVNTLLAAVFIVVASVQHDADAARYDNPAVAGSSIDPLQIAIFSPLPNTLAELTLPPAMGAKTVPSPFIAEMTMFALAPEKVPSFGLPTSMPTAILPDTGPHQAYAAPAEPAPEVKPLAMAPEKSPEGATAYAPPHEAAPEAKPRELGPSKRATTPRQRAQADVQRIAFDAPSLAPFAHTRFCLKYPSDCRVDKILFRGGAIDLNAKRRAELVRVNAAVNREIRPERINDTVVGEKWLIAPKSGDCHDYAVTKRHELLGRGWPARSLLLAEVVTSWGEHHLVLVVRTRQGDFVADNLNANIRNWSKTPYQWVRVELPVNPMFWSTIKAAQPDVVAMAGHDRQL
jgi:predicted transglutaminase-like cysteine proteinase